MEIQNKMINILMVSGKKSKAEKILQESFTILEKVYKKDVNGTFTLAVSNVSPSFEIRSIRIAGRTQQIPFPIKKSKQIATALKWIVSGSKSVNKYSFAEKLAFELNEASMGKGFAIKKRDEIHRNAESNRAFAHFRWC